ncbi:MAG TPA: hypothetical protein VLF69_01345 [Candidatus Saccharimonadales bacterium]|nr:hypothetical protein [Candidatus Saccharimonadales bacterium]
MNWQKLDKYRPLILVAVIVIATGVVFVAKSTVHSVQKHTVNGTLDLSDVAFVDLKNGDACEGSGGYDDIVDGAQVKVVDGNGSTLALSELRGGTADGNGSCKFTFEIANIKKSAFYTFTVSHRGGLDFSAKDLATADYKVDFTLGQ